MRRRGPVAVRGRAAATALGLSAAVAWGGCAASPGPAGGGPASSGAGGTGSVGAADLAEASPRAGGLIPGLDRGLRTRRWRVDRERLEAPLGEILTALAVVPPPETGLDDSVREHLARNGLRMLAVPRASLETLRTRLAAPPRQIETWHGEAVDWRSLLVGRPGAGVSVVAVGDRVRPHPGGEYRLAVRAWTMRMESGPHLHVELRVEHVEPRRESGLRLTPEAPAVRLVDALLVELAAPADLAWVIASAPSSETWPEPGRTGATPESAGGDADASEPVVATGPGLGPPAAAIPTVGQLLLPQSPGTGEHEILILEAELPPSLAPRPIADRRAGDIPGRGGRS
ncbi:MAG: hypothetical protein ACYTEV_01165 [Planctomycetota bacterium]